MQKKPETVPTPQPAPAPTAAPSAAFASDVAAMRSRARAGMGRGAVTDDYGVAPQLVVQMLNEALATEIVCYLRYKRHYFVASGIKAKVAASEFLEHANQEQAHADMLAKRIVELGGEPNFDPRGIELRSHAEYVEGKDLKEMIEGNLIAERVAIESYRAMIEWLAGRDPTTRRLLEEILSVEEEHADDMHSLLKGI